MFHVTFKILLMNRPLLFTAHVLFLFITCLYMGACSNGGQPKSDAIDTLTAGTAKKGKIWDKVNVVQIPLTLEENNMVGPVKTVTYRNYIFVKKEGQYRKQLDALGYNVYDKFGHITDQNEYEADSTPKWKCIYRYDSNNKAIEWYFRFYERDDEYKTTFIYDNAGYNIEQKITNVKPGKSERILLRFDENGNEVESVTFDTADVMKTATVSEYDKFGNQTKYTNQSVDGKATFQLTASYDSNGYKIAGTIAMMGELTSKWKGVNDSKGRMIEKRDFDADGTFRRKTTYKYDTRGNIIEMISYNAAGKLDTTVWNSFYQYQYDSVGNIIRETNYDFKSDNEIPKNYIEREFTYY